MLKKTIFFVSVILFSVSLLNTAYAQPTWTLNPFGKEKKPEQYEEKKLGSEKTADKKFTTVRKLIQNNITHYNYYFNANNKLNAVIERAKLAQKDDYGKLLSFYPYTLQNTASQQVELDSVIYKSTAGILLHDLRSDWVDNLYLLIGKAYFLRNELDSAALTFQFINYNLFPRKKKEDDSRTVGANESASANVISIADKEKRNIVQKALTKPPSRNDALIWMIRTLTDKKEYGDAAGLINILENDPNLPKRLRNDLEEVTAYWFYSQDHFDSSAIHLEKAISTADTKQDKARWEYLLGQLFEMSGQFDKASDYYAKVSKHTIDPVMDIYARLNDAKMFRQSGNKKELENSIAKLLKMAKKDKYEAYRDIIYYSTAQLSVQQPDTTKGISFYLKSLSYNENNSAYRGKSFLDLANIAYHQRDYKNAYAYYDSLMLDTAALDMDVSDIVARRDALAKVVEQMTIIEREDSLQMIAAMSPADRDAFIKKMLKIYKKKRGLKDDETGGSGTDPIRFGNDKQPDMFPGNSPSKKGDWYFYNPSLKSRGFNEFKSKWGKRTNVDNWRRKSSSDALINRNSGGMDPLAPGDSSKMLNANIPPPQELSLTALSLNIPLSQEKLDTSNAMIAAGLIKLGKLFQFELQDHVQAIITFDEYLKRFPGKTADEAYLGLYYSYSKLGNAAKAAYYKDLLTTKYPQSQATNLLLNPASTQPDKKNPEVTKRYETIYNMFIEGRFDEALEAKKREDSVYGQTYWTPQLLYIEAIQYVKEKNDSNAIRVLNSIITLYPTSPLKEKAQTMISVLNRRAEIENYLTNLQVTKADEDHVIIGNDKPAVTLRPETKTPVTTIASNKPPSSVILKDTVMTIPGMTNGVFTIEPDKPHYVIMILEKVDGVYLNEARNAFMRYNRQYSYGQPITINKDQLDTDRSLLIFTPFEDADAAVVYYDKIKKAAPSEVSWLHPSKYSFLIITDSNLQLLKTNKDVKAYKTLLNSQFNNKF